jgi:hypothetical protein
MSRSSAIDNIRTVVEHRIAARREMTLAVLVAGVAGLLTSFVTLHLGLTRMAARYPVAVAVAYLAFLAYLWLWLRRHGLKVRSDARGQSLELSPMDLDVVEFPFRLDSGAAFEGFGQGGGFSGAGGGTEWTGSGTTAPVRLATTAPVSKSAGVAGGVDLDDGAWVLIVAAVAAALVLGAAMYVIYIAPILFAEILLDAALAAGLYRRLRDVDRRRWWQSAIRRTLLPAVVSALIMSIAGAIMQSVYPEASSIGKVWRAATSSRASTH